jgi:hypothetical protein
MFVVFDLDGTLALNEHRQHFVQRPDGSAKDWRAFFAACDKDVPNMPIINTALAFNSAGDRVEIWSGRSAEVNDKTEAWLKQNGLGIIPRRMRADGDHTPDHTLKAQWLGESEVKPNLVFDDRASVVAMWRANGIVCAQVAPGDF